MAPVSINTGIPRPDKSAFDVPPDQLKPLAMARRRWAEIDLPCDCRLMKQVYDEAPVFAEAMGYKSGDQFITDYLSLDLDLVHRVIGWLEQEQPSEAVPLQLAIEQAKAQPLAKHGEIGNGRADESRGSDATSTGQGRGRSYLLRRIARDQPELLDQIGDGKPYRSARAAAIAAGIVKSVPTIRLVDDPAKVAAALRKHLSQQQIACLVQELQLSPQP
jgi:plasmid stabilization system protein ParE